MEYRYRRDDHIQDPLGRAVIIPDEQKRTEQDGKKYRRHRAVENGGRFYASLFQIRRQPDKAPRQRGGRYPDKDGVYPQRGKKRARDVIGIPQIR